MIGRFDGEIYLASIAIWKKVAPTDRKMKKRINKRHRLGFNLFRDVDKLD